MLRLTRAQVRRIDELALRDYNIPGIVLMENAARAAALEALDMLAGQRRVLIYCGGGNNGGDGLAIARHLQNAGCDASIVKCFEETKLPPDAATNWRIVQAMKLPIIEATAKAPLADLIIDALLGTGLSTPPRPPIVSAIASINTSGTPVLAIDIPSGLDCDTGQPLGQACVRAQRTITFVSEKVGFATAAARAFTGDVVVGDIGCPRELIEQVSAAQVV